MLALLILLLANLLAALPEKSQRSQEEQDLDLVYCSDSETCCRWSLFPDWSFAFRKEGKFPPVVSAIPSFDPATNIVGRIQFKCYDTRLEDAIPFTEVKARGPFNIICRPGQILTSWPVAGDLVKNDPEQNQWYHRSSCQAILTWPVEFPLPASSSKCTLVTTPAEMDTYVLTAYSVDRNNAQQLVNNLISIYQVPDAFTDPNAPIPSHFFGLSELRPSLSVVVSGKTKFLICAKNYGAVDRDIVTYAMDTVVWVHITENEAKPLTG